MTKIKKLTVSAVALAAVFAGSAAVAGTLEDVKSRDKLIVGVKNDYPPYGFLNDKGEIVGFEVSLAKYVAKELLGSEDKIELVPVVAANRIEFLTAGRVDTIFATLGVNADRDKVIDFTTQYVSAAGPSVLMAKEATISKWEELKGKPVCGIQGSYYNKKMTEGIRHQPRRLQGPAGSLSRAEGQPLHRLRLRRHDPPAEAEGSRLVDLQDRRRSL